MRVVYTVHDTLMSQLPEAGARTALVHGTERVTYDELHGRVNGAAVWLQARGVRRGDRVAIHLRKSVEEVVATFAVAKIGAVFVNISPQRTTRQLRYIVDDCQCEILFTDTRRAIQIAGEGWLDRFRHVVTPAPIEGEPNVVPWDTLPREGEGAGHPRPIDQDLAALLYTSGSTGMPKGVMITHANLVDGTRRVAQYLENTSDDRILGLVPLSAPWGVIQLTTMFLVGGAVVLQPTPFPAEILRTLKAHDVTGMAAFPETWIDMVQLLEAKPTPLPSLRYITSSGGKIPDATLRALPRVFPETGIVLTYGLTEAFRSTYLPPEAYHRKAGSLGKPCPNVDVFLIGSDGHICGPGEQGELIHRGTLVTKGYWNRPEATAEKIRSCEPLRYLIGDEKVHYSGDIVRMDEEGYLWFVGRVEAMIKCSGYRISPTEVEEIIYESGLEGNAVAFGVPDPRLGEVVHVAVRSEGPPVDPDAIMQYCRKHMPAYMFPRKLHVWDEAMPRAATGKVDRLQVIHRSLARDS